MLRLVPIIAGAVLIVLLGVVQGVWSDRWNQDPAAAKRFAERLENVPLNVGDWEGKDESNQADPRILDVAGAAGHKSIVYQNQKTGKQVSVYLVCGHSRKITGHTPDICYPASGFSAVGQQIKQPLDWDNSTSEFNSKVFRKDSREGIETLRVFWAWAVDRNWQAPDNPRRTFPRVQALYKMYLISPVQSHDERPDQSPCVEFARVFMPQLNNALFGEAPKTEL
jgi:hypothetical protein